MLKTVIKNSRKIRDTIQIYELFDKPKFYEIGNISKITKNFISIKTKMSEYRFNRATGYVVGFDWPYIVWAIAPETV